MRSIKILASIALASAVVLMATGCDRKDADKTAGQKLDTAIADTRQEGQKAGEYIEQKTAQATQATGDAAITASVKARLLADDELKALDISVDTAGGVVTLTGVAPNPAAKSRATDVAKVVDGVVDVKNDLGTN